MSETPARTLPTDEEWAAIERTLAVPHSAVKLLVDDDYGVTLCVLPYETRKYGIMVYVNGKFSYTHISEDCEERRRFMRKSTRQAYPRKRRDEIVKAFGKGRAKKYFPDLEKTYDTYTPLWLTFAPLKRHLLASNTNIELLSNGWED